MENLEFVDSRFVKKCDENVKCLIWGWTAVFYLGGGTDLPGRVFASLAKGQLISEGIFGL